MAEWVQKGNLKGPQGDPGQDAQLPAGGTEGQVLTKTADGEAWADAPEPDMTGVVKASGDSVHILTADGTGLSNIGIGDLDSDLTAIGPTGIDIQSTGSGSIGINASGGYASLGVSSGGPSINLIGASANLTIGSKSVTSITDDASTGSEDALATAKAVKDYADAHAMPSVVPISKGGTGATTADGARTALGISVADPTELVEYVKSKLGGA